MARRSCRSRWDGSDRKVVLARATPQTLLSPDGVHVLSRAGPRRHIYLFERPQVADSVTIDPIARDAGRSRAPPDARRRRFPVVLARRQQSGLEPRHDALRLRRRAGRQGRPRIRCCGAAPTRRRRAARSAPDSAAPRRRTIRPGGRGSGLRRRNGRRPTTPRVTTITIAVAADKPTGVIVLRGARIVTMKDREVIENGDIVVTGNRITAVGPRGRSTIPRGARTIDVKGKTILPGYVDVHAQMAAPSQVHRTVVPQYLANLAFGVTTTRDPEAQATDIFTYARSRRARRADRAARVRHRADRARLGRDPAHQSPMRATFLGAVREQLSQRHRARRPHRDARRPPALPDREQGARAHARSRTARRISGRA